MLATDWPRSPKSPGSGSRLGGHHLLDVLGDGFHFHRRHLAVEALHVLATLLHDGHQRISRPGLDIGADDQQIDQVPRLTVAGMRPQAGGIARRQP